MVIPQSGLGSVRVGGVFLGVAGTVALEGEPTGSGSAALIGGLIYRNRNRNLTHHYALEFASFVRQ